MPTTGCITHTPLPAKRNTCQPANFDFHSAAAIHVCVTLSDICFANKKLKTNAKKHKTKKAKIEN